MPFTDNTQDQPEGVQARQKLVDAGFSQSDVQQWEVGQRGKLAAGGFSSQEIDSYFGNETPDTTPLQQQLAASVEPYSHNEAQNPWDDLVAGWQQGNTGLMQTQAKPTMQLGANANLFDKTVSAFGEFASDVPSMAVGAIGGAIAGAPIAGVGALPGALIGAVAVPAAEREALLKIYNHQGPWSWSDAASTALATASEGSKAAAAGMVGNKAGQLAEQAVEPFAGKAVGWLTSTVTGATVGTGVQAGLEGHVPNADDFITGAIVAVGVGAGHWVGAGAAKRFMPSTEGTQVIQNLQDIYQRTGMAPEHVLKLMSTDEQVHNEVMGARNANGDILTPTLDAYAARMGLSTGKTFGPAPASPYEPLKPVEEPAAKPPAAEEEPAPGQMKPEQVPQVTLDTVRTLEQSADDAVSPAGAVGRYQIMPSTARAYGFDPQYLSDPAYNERTARTILADLDNRFKGNMADMLVAYNAGPGRASAWIRGGRDFHSLPLETQKYLLHAEHIGAVNDGFTSTVASADLVGDEASDSSHDMPAHEPEPAETEGEEPKPAAAEDDDNGPITKAEADQYINDRVGQLEPPESWAEKLNLGKVFRGFQFALTPAHAFDKSNNLSPTDVGVEHIARATYGTSGQANLFYTHGPIELDFDEHGNPVFKATKGDNFLDAYKAVAKNGGSLEGFRNYRLSMRALEKHEQNVDTGIPKEVAQAVVNDPGAFEKYDAAHRMIQRAWDGVNDFSVTSGMMSAKRIDGMNALNEEYIPMNRMLDNSYVPPKWGGLFGVKQSYKKMQGSDRPFVPPEIAEMDNLNVRVKMAMRNLAVAHMIDSIRAADPDAAELVKITKNTAVQEAKDAADALKDDNGIELPDEVKAAMEPILTARELLSNLKHERGLAEPDRDVVVFRDGEPEVWRIKDDALAHMVKESTGGPEDAIPGLVGAFGRLARSGITSMPTFPFRALWHSAIAGAAFNEGGSHIVFGNLIYGTLAAVAGDKMGGYFQGAYERFAANGGLGGTFNEVNRNMINPKLDDLFNGSPKGPLVGGIVNVVRHPVEAIRTIQHMAHNASQVGASIVSQRKGVSALRAVQMARKGGLDYNEKFVSPTLNTWARAVPFMPTGFKDVQQVSNAIVDHPLATTVKVAATLILPTFGLTMANRLADKDLAPQDRYINLPLWLRDNYWVLPPINGVRIKIPKPYVGGAAFATLPERIFNYAWDEAHGDSEQAGMDFENLVQGMLGRAAPPFMPVMPEPVLEQVTNHNFFLNRPLVPDALAQKDGYLQYSPSTSSTSRAIANFLSQIHLSVGNARLDQTSPIVLDNYINEWTGPAGTLAWRELGDVASFQPELLKQMGVNKSEEPTELADNPIYGSWFVRNPGAGQMEDELYDRADQVSKARSRLQAAIKGGDPASIQAAVKDPLASINLTSTIKALANMRGFIQTVNQNKDMSDPEKLKITDTLAAQMYQISYAQVRLIDQLKSGVANGSQQQ